MSTPSRQSIRVSCPRCGGNVKVPPYQAGQRCTCPRCGAEIVVPDSAAPAAVQGNRQADVPATLATLAGSVPSAAATAAQTASPPASVPLATPAAPKPAISYDDVYGITCPVCQARLHVRPHQAGTTLKCPDCYSSVPVPAPPKRRQPPPSAQSPAPRDDPAGIGSTGLRTNAQRLLEKARADLEQEEAEEREQSPDRFTRGLFDFLLDPRVYVWMVILAVWFTLVGGLLRLGSTTGEDAGTLSQGASPVVLVLLGGFFLAFLVLTAAFAWALVSGTSQGSRRIEHWPGVHAGDWDRDFRYVFSAGFLAALPGVLAGLLLGLIGIKGMVLYAAAATFGGLFPPMLLSMVESGSALTPFSKDAWGSIRQRPAPWNFTYLMTSILIILGLFGAVTALGHGFPLGLAGAVLMVLCMTLYFRTIGRLFAYLAGRDL